MPFEVYLIGSDSSLRAIETTIKNIEHAGLDNLNIDSSLRPVIKHGSQFSYHYPRPDYSESLVDLKEPMEKTYLSLYHGDAIKVGDQLADLTDGFKDFSLITNIPYGTYMKENDLQ